MNIPGDVRVSIERLDYISDVGTIASYLQCPRAWVEQVKRAQATKPRRGTGGGLSCEYNGPTGKERDAGKSTKQGSIDLGKAIIAAYQSYALRCGRTTQFVAEHLLACRCPIEVAMAERQAHEVPRKEANS